VLILSHTIKCGWAIKFVDWLQVRLNLICTKRGGKMLMIVGELIILMAIPLCLFFLEVTILLVLFSHYCNSCQIVHCKLAMICSGFIALRMPLVFSSFIMQMGGAIPD